MTKKLQEVYPDFIVDFEANNIIWNDNTKMIFNDCIDAKIFTDLLESPCIANMMMQEYPKGKMTGNPQKNSDPGRIRYEPLFLKMYGKTKVEAEAHIVEITWCPKLVGQKIKVTTVNGIDKKLKAISTELDKHPELLKYISKVNGTFEWRKINGGNRQSMHSFGNAIDLNSKYATYWQWDCKCADEDRDVVYKNNLPQVIVDIFEKYGFIWGGKWYHYDTMHFEYRPELL